VPCCSRRRSWVRDGFVGEPERLRKGGGGRTIWSDVAARLLGTSGRWRSDRPPHRHLVGPVRRLSHHPAVAATLPLGRDGLSLAIPGPHSPMGHRRARGWRRHYPPTRTCSRLAPAKEKGRRSRAGGLREGGGKEPRRNPAPAPSNRRATGAEAPVGRRSRGRSPCRNDGASHNRVAGAGLPQTGDTALHGEGRSLPLWASMIVIGCVRREARSLGGLRLCESRNSRFVRNATAIGRSDSHFGKRPGSCSSVAPEAS